MPNGVSLLLQCRRFVEIDEVSSSIEMLFFDGFQIILVNTILNWNLKLRQSYVQWRSGIECLLLKFRHVEATFLILYQIVNILRYQRL